MTDDLSAFCPARLPPPARPLLGLTVLVIEDSRYASEAMRLLCLRSGARIRRADCLRSAHRHLCTYRPGAIVVDMGLPDGSGADLIGEIRAMTPPHPVILATSGDPDAESEAIAAGADGFLAKPVESLARFQSAILRALPRSEWPKALRVVSEDRVTPDPIALREDLLHAEQALRATANRAELGYLGRFIAGVARTAHDDALEIAAASLTGEAGPSRSDVSRVTGIVQARLATGNAF